MCVCVCTTGASWGEERGGARLMHTLGSSARCMFEISFLEQRDVSEPTGVHARRLVPFGCLHHLVRDLKRPSVQCMFGLSLETYQMAPGAMHVWSNSYSSYDYESMYAVAVLEVYAAARVLALKTW